MENKGPVGYSAQAPRVTPSPANNLSTEAFNADVDLVAAIIRQKMSAKYANVHPQSQVPLTGPLLVTEGAREAAAAIVIALSSAVATPWEDIESAPRDGTVFAGWRRGWDFPQSMCWEKPSSDDGSHAGCVGHWVYADWLQHDADVDGIDLEFWLPFPELPECQEARAIEWLPIETAPKDGAIYIVNDLGPDHAWGTANWVRDTVRDRGELVGWWDNGLWLEPQPTHWLPIPPPPR